MKNKFFPDNGETLINEFVFVAYMVLTLIEATDATINYTYQKTTG